MYHLALTFDSFRSGQQRRADARRRRPPRVPAVRARVAEGRLLQEDVGRLSRWSPTGICDARNAIPVYPLRYLI